MILLVTGAFGGAKNNIDASRKLGHTVYFLQNEKDELSCDYSLIEGVICNGLFLYHDIDKFTNLKFIQLTSAGFDRVPMDRVTKRGIKIFNARGVYGKPIAEFAVGGVLTLYKKSRELYENQKLCKWEKQRDLLELAGKTVLIVGCGDVGTECAKRFKAFECNVIGVDIAPYKNEYFSEMVCLSDMDEKLAVADIVVLTLPLTEESEGLFNSDKFEKMKDGAVIVNVARGAIVEENALIAALKNKLLGAVIDVFNKEPLFKNDPLWKIENVIVTPHNSFVGDGNEERLMKVITANLKAFL